MGKPRGKQQLTFSRSLFCEKPKKILFHCRCENRVLLAMNNLCSSYYIMSLNSHDLNFKTIIRNLNASQLWKKKIRKLQLKLSQFLSNMRMSNLFSSRKYFNYIFIRKKFKSFPISLHLPSTNNPRILSDRAIHWYYNLRSPLAIMKSHFTICNPLATYSSLLCGLM